MKNSLIDRFIEAISCICLPEILLINALGKLTDKNCKKLLLIFNKYVLAITLLVCFLINIYVLEDTDMKNLKRMLFQQNLHPLRGKAFEAMTKFENLFSTYMGEYLYLF